MYTLVPKIVDMTRIVGSRRCTNRRTKLDNWDILDPTCGENGVYNQARRHAPSTTQISPFRLYASTGMVRWSLRLILFHQLIKRWTCNSKTFYGGSSCELLWICFPLIICFDEFWRNLRTWTPIFSTIT